jgi:hypothetical protein
MGLKHFQRGSRATLLLLGAGTLAWSACGYDDLATPGEGTLRVATLTTGTGLDANGYTVVANNGEPENIEVTDTIYLENLDVGLYTVTLGGLQENCEALEGTNPREITVLPADTVGVTFNVTCTTPPPGGGGGGEPIP